MTFITAIKKPKRRDEWTNATAGGHDSTDIDAIISSAGNGGYPKKVNK